MEKDIFDIKLMDMPIVKNRDVKDNVNSDRFNDMIEYVIKAKTWLEWEAMRNKPSFVVTQAYVAVKHVIIQPTVANNVGLQRFWDNISCVIGYESILFKVHISHQLGSYMARAMEQGIRGTSEATKKLNIWRG